MMTIEDGRETWSNLTINEIVTHLNILKMRIPYLEEKMTIELARGSIRGADVTVSVLDETATNTPCCLKSISTLQVGVTERRLADGLQDIVPERIQRQLSLVSLCRLSSIASRGLIARMKTCENGVFQALSIFAGSGDGRLTDELKMFITLWIEERL